jgi:hypothetical protein
MSLDRRNIAVAATGGIVGFAVEALVYSLLVVPRLPTIQSVPLWWWFGVVAAPTAVFLVVGYVSRSARELILLTVTAFLPWQIGRIVWSLSTGHPLMHDIWATDVHFWVSLIIEYVVWLFVGVLGYGLSRAAVRTRAA